METRQCRYCKGLFPEDAFGVALTTPRKVFRRRKCRDCYRDTKNLLINRHLEWINARKQDKGCKRCGIRDPRVLDFHHTGGQEKLFSVGNFRRAVGFERIQAEVGKCEVVCANCHRILHDEERRVRKNGA